MDTVLETGPGAWELKAKGQYRDSSKYKVTSTLKAIPTRTHMALVQLHKVCMCVGGQVVGVLGVHYISGRTTEVCCQPEL